MADALNKWNHAEFVPLPARERERDTPGAAEFPPLASNGEPDGACGYSRGH